MDVGCNLRGFGGPTNRQNNKKTNQKRILASKKNMWENILSLTQEMIFFKISHDENSYDTAYLQHCTVKKMFLNFFLREFSSAAPNKAAAIKSALTIPPVLVRISLIIFFLSANGLFRLIFCHQCCVWCRGLTLDGLLAITLSLKPIKAIGYRWLIIFQ